MNSKVNFFIVGQPKCGTTSLYHYFKKHNEVFMPDQKQLYFFAKDHNDHRKKYAKFNTDHYSKYYNYKFEDYISRFNFQEEINVYGDITPDYIYSKTAPSDIYEYNNNAKILVILREPLSSLLLTLLIFSSIFDKFFNFGKNLSECFILSCTIFKVM